LAAQDAHARFEVPVEATVPCRGWRIALTGRIDQLLQEKGRIVVREIKTTLQALPMEPASLREHYEGHFIQLAVYQCLHREPDQPPGILHGELVFVEPATGITQVLAQSPSEALTQFENRLGELCAFAETRRSSLERLRTLHFKPAFPSLRPGQEAAQADLRAAAARSPVVLFEAPTGYGKTGCALEYGLETLAQGHLTRVIYLTGKSTGQLEVVRQLREMLGDPPGASAWQIRSKAEHCIHDTFHCVRTVCPHLDDLPARWTVAGLASFALDTRRPRDLESLRDAGRSAAVCPYEITRASLPFADIWIADYNYLFAPANRNFLSELPGFDPAQTLLIIDEAHNLPSRVADAWSSELTSNAARFAAQALEYADAPSTLRATWEKLSLLLSNIEPTEQLDAETAHELHERLGAVAAALPNCQLDYAALGPAASDTLHQAADLHAAAESGHRSQPELLWSPARGVVRFTCIDASAAIAETLHSFGHVLFLSATLSPTAAFLRSCGIAHLDPPPAVLTAPTPWRESAYTIAIDTRVDTRYEQRSRHETTTARTIAELARAPGNGPVVVFFPSYAYAARIAEQLRATHPDLRSATQPRGAPLPAQRAFIEESLLLSDILLLVLGGALAEGIDLLGGRADRAIVVGPALPEVNAVQRARLAASRAPDRESAFREIYQIPGMIKVNQALGRLVRAPGQRARVLLHCRRFALPAYRDLLAPEYREGAMLANDSDLLQWLG